MNREKEIVDKCILALNELPLIKKAVFIERIGGFKECGIDGSLKIDLESGSQIKLLVEVKGLLKRPLPEHLQVLMKYKQSSLILFSEYVNSSIARDLKRNGINYVDIQGNVYLYIPNDIFINIRGKSRQKAVETQQTALFQPKGLQLLFVLLTEPDAVNLSVRELQKLAGISFERTATAMRELKEKGYLLQSGRNNYRLIRRHELLEKWIANYGDRLRPNIFIGAYKASPKGKHELSGLLRTYMKSEIYYALGGQSAAELLTNYYRANIMDIFFDLGEFNKISQTVNLIPAKDFNIRVFSLFSDKIVSDIEVDGYMIANPLLIYAEMLYNGGDRERESARILYDKYLQELFE